MMAVHSWYYPVSCWSPRYVGTPAAASWTTCRYLLRYRNAGSKKNDGSSTMTTNRNRPYFIIDHKGRTPPDLRTGTNGTIALIAVLSGSIRHVTAHDTICVHFSQWSREASTAVCRNPACPPIKYSTIIASTVLSTLYIE